MMHRLTPGLALIAAALLAFPLGAMAEGVVSVLTVARVVVKPGGADEQLVAAEQVKPGDLLQYTATYRNTGKQPVKRLAATLPIPAGTELVAASPMPRDALARTGTEPFAAIPLMRKVRRADGQLVDTPVPLAEYRTLRWPERDLAAGASVATSARVRVIAPTDALVVATAAAAAASAPR